MRSSEVKAMETGVIKPINPAQAYAAVQNASKEIVRLSGINAKRVEPVQNTSASVQSRETYISPEKSAIPTADKKQAEIVVQTKASDILKQSNVTRGYVINPDVGIVYQETDERTGDIIEQLPSERELARRVYEKKANSEANYTSSQNLPSTIV